MEQESIMKIIICRLLKDESGQAHVEYILIGALICCVSLGYLKLFKAGLASSFNKTANIRTSVPLGIGP
jgi:Flp pilus assembly pilin Flp